MPSFFDFQQGHEHNPRSTHDSSPLLGRFRAVPDRNPNQRTRGRGDSVGRLLRNSYGTIWDVLRGDSDDEDGEADGLLGPSAGSGRGDDIARGWKKNWKRSVVDLWIRPQQGAVRRCLDRWWSRWGVLIVLPAAVAVTWCALPFPLYPFTDEQVEMNSDEDSGHNAPGHGEARVRLNFWFFLFVYYGFYNVTALMWITKVFNIYSLNWWPQSIGFPITVSTIAALSIAAPIPMYYFPETREFLSHNTTWILWTFFTMAMPVAVAWGILMSHERHLGLRQSLSDTQRIFTSSWWTNEGDEDTIARRDRRRPPLQPSSFDPHSSIDIMSDMQARPAAREAVRLRTLWIPASFMRFMWFCLALSIGLIAYVLGETYAEIYLRTLPHSNIQTIVYVYSWVATIHLLDGLTGWILGGGEGERVGSYPLGWIFKLYFSLTYQTYVRALYARLRTPKTFIILQILSSTGLILIHPLTMSTHFHTVLSILGLNNQPYQLYQKYCGRSIFIRSLSESVSMLSFLGQILVLHFGHNKDVYPYFAFDEVPSNSTTNSTMFPNSILSPGAISMGKGYPYNPIPLPDFPDANLKTYDFALTFWASLITWVCELTSAFIVRKIVKWVYSFDVGREGRGDLGAWPELLPTGVIVMVHVLQNMIFGIVRLEF